MNITDPSTTSINASQNTLASVSSSYNIYQAWFKIYQGDFNTLPANPWVQLGTGDPVYVAGIDQPSTSQNTSNCYFDTTDSSRFVNDGSTVYTLVVWIVDEGTPSTFQKDKKCFTFNMPGAPTA